MSTILLVEDDVTSREMLVHRLVNCGYQVLQAGTGKDALEMILCCLPDLILLDITLPDINGLEVLSNLKGNTKTSNIPVVIVSGRNTSEDIISGLNMGASDYITKPYQWGIINARIKSALRTVEVSRLLKEALYHEKVNVQTKSDFLVNMSHEIRTPLNGILGVIQLMESTGLTAQQEEYLKIMNRSGEALIHIVNSLLDISKIEAGHLDIDQQPFNIEEMVQSVSEMIYPKACQKELEIFINSEPGINLDVIGDQARISQIITNYAANALKFTEKGCITFNIKSNQGSPKGAVYRIEVEDTGIGLSTEAQKKLFQKFIQADASISNEYGGTGLGLAICKQIAEAMSGHVGMFSKEGCGTKFWVEIPLKYNDDTVESRKTLDLHDKNILIIGSSYFCTNYCEILSQAKANVTTSADIPKGDVEKYDLILTTDVSCHENKTLEGLPVVSIHEGLSGVTKNIDGMHLQEPIKPSELIKAIREALSTEQPCSS